MTIAGLSNAEKLHFLEILINKTNPKLASHFLSLYVALGDDIFLVFSLLSGMSIDFANQRDFRAAQSAVKAASETKVPSKTRAGKDILVTVPRVFNYLDITNIKDQTLTHIPSGEEFLLADVKKGETYFIPSLKIKLLVLSPVRTLLGRDYLVYAEDTVTIHLPEDLSSEEEDPEGMDDFLTP